MAREHYISQLGGGWDRREGVGRDELSLLDNVSPNGLRDVSLGGDGAERDVEACRSL